MEDELSRKLDGLLNSPEGLAKIQEMMTTLGVGGETTTELPAPSAAPAADDDGMLAGLLNLAPLLGSLGQDDRHTALLKALRPYLHGGREKRLDESVKLLQILKLLPLLQQKGGLFG